MSSVPPSSLETSRTMQPPVPSTSTSAPQTEHTLRRVRSENDLLFPNDITVPTALSSPAPVRRAQQQQRRSHRVQRSEGWQPSSPSIAGAATQTPRTLAAAPPRPPDQAVVRPINDRMLDPDTFEIIQALNDLPPDIRFEIVGDHLREGQRRTTRQRDADRVPPGWRGKILVFLGQAGPDMRLRSKLMSFVWSLSFGLVQVGIIEIVSPNGTWQLICFAVRDHSDPARLLK